MISDIKAGLNPGNVLDVIVALDHSWPGAYRDVVLSNPKRLLVYLNSVQMPDKPYVQHIKADNSDVTIKAMGGARTDAMIEIGFSDNALPKYRIIPVPKGLKIQLYPIKPGPMEMAGSDTVDETASGGTSDETHAVPEADRTGSEGIFAGGANAKGGESLWTSGNGVQQPDSDGERSLWGDDDLKTVESIGGKNRWIQGR